MVLLKSLGCSCQVTCGGKLSRYQTVASHHRQVADLPGVPSVRLTRRRLKSGTCMSYVLSRDGRPTCAHDEVDEAARRAWGEVWEESLGGVWEHGRSTLEVGVLIWTGLS